MVTIRTIARHERDAVLDLLAAWFDDRAFFQRYFENDPAFRDDLCLVAEEGGRLVSTLQIFPKTIRINGASLRLGGIGNVFTAASHRRRGIASLLLHRAIAIMEAEEFDVSLLFATRLAFYAQFGWASHRRLLGAVSPPAARPAPDARVRPFEVERDLGAVMAVYDAYNRERSGAVVRDRRYWEGQLRYAGTPDETFLVAERAGRIAAYARLVTLYDVPTVMEHGAADGGADALRDAVLALAAQVPPDGFLVIHLGADRALGTALAQAGCAINEVEDVFTMWRVIAPARTASTLGLEPAALEHPEVFDRLLPYGGSVYWTSDRF